MHSARTYANQYRQTGVSSAVLEANPHQLIALMELAPLRADQGRWGEALALCERMEPLARDREELRKAYAPEKRLSVLRREGEVLCLAVEHEGRLIGDVVFFWHSKEQRSGEIGYAFNPEFSGRGFATETARALLGGGKPADLKASRGIGSWRTNVASSPIRICDPLVAFGKPCHGPF